MNVEIISHDPSTGLAHIKFTHNNVVVEDTYNLRMVIPGSEKVLSSLGQDFTKELQLKALDNLTATMTSNIESGAITNLPHAK